MRVHIVSHSHWDREWYQSFDKHRMNLVELFDDLLELFETDKEFRSFHLDGQFIPLDDYLEIRPHKEAELKKWIAQGRLIVGPYYILQDELLLSGEENVRNALVGKSYTKKWGDYMPQIGYFPDTFGHVGQLAQLCVKAGWKYAFIGRGVKPIGFDNQVVEDENFTSQYSEMWLEAPDGSKVLGILFANWYNNGNEIPTDREKAKVFWDKKIADAKRFASTDSLLFMNGCDHQPVQKDLSDAIRVANELYPEITFVHSSLEEYAKELEQKLPSDLAVIKGEMTSQETDGWYTLANTASSRIGLKQSNMRIADKLTTIAEPLSYMAKDYVAYPQEELDYVWKMLLQNLPHDSICGCSIDAVHKEMETRFRKAEDTLDFVIDKVFSGFIKGVDTSALPQGAIPFVVCNPSPNAKEEIIKEVHSLRRHYFKDSTLRPERLYDQVEALEHPNYNLYRFNGEKVEATVRFAECRFGYDLPKDAFRDPYIAENYEIEFLNKMEPMSWEVFYFMEETAKTEDLNQNVSAEKSSNLVFANDYYALKVKDGKLHYRNQKLGRSSEELFYFENTGDIGNEYIYFAPKGEAPIYSKLADAHVLEKTDYSQKWKLRYELVIPTKADDFLQREQKGLIEFMKREAKRGKELTTFVVEVELSMWRDSTALKTKIRFDNQCKNHRLRLMVDSMCKKAETHFADSSFEIVSRDNKVSKYWKNPTNPQHLLKVVGMTEDEFTLAVSATGLQEYEIMPENKIALTLLRSTEELGDWGYFPTVDSLSLGISEYEVDIVSFGAKDYRREIKKCLAKGSGFLTKVTDRQSAGEVPMATVQKLPQEECVFYTALKKMDNSDAYCVRYVHLGEDSIDFAVSGKYLNLLEEEMQEANLLHSFSIRTEKLDS